MDATENELSSRTNCKRERNKSEDGPPISIDERRMMNGEGEYSTKRLWPKD